MRTSMARSRGRLLIIGLVLVAAVAVGPASGAEAQDAGPSAAGGAERVTVARSGRPGRIVSMPRVVGSHSWDGFTWSPWIRQTGPVVTRSPRNRAAQRVCVRYYLEIWNSGWVRQTDRTRCAFLRSGQGRVRLPRFDVAGLTRGNWFRMTHVHSWWRNGRAIGSRVVVMNRPAEYACNSLIDTCFVNRGGLCLRAPSTGTCR